MLRYSLKYRIFSILLPTLKFLNQPLDGFNYEPEHFTGRPTTEPDTLQRVTATVSKTLYSANSKK